MFFQVDATAGFGVGRAWNDCLLQHDEGDMEQTWKYNLSNVPSEEPAAPPRGAWFWIKQVFLFPFRMLGLFVILVVVPGTFSMWVLPDVAERYKVDTNLLVLRILDEEGAGRPFRRLGYQKTIHTGLLDLRPGDASIERGKPLNQDDVVSVKQSRTPEGEAYAIRFASGQTQTIVPTTPHTIVPPQELAAARHAVSRLFPPADRKQWTEVLNWGESLFVSSWVRKYDLKTVPRDRFPGPIGGTEDEQLWCVWQVLRSGGAPEEELFRLPELFLQTFPEKEDQQAALGWANTLYERLNNFFLYRRPGYASAESRSRLYSTYASFKQVLPPDTPWSRLWLLQQYVGLSPAAQTAARQRWLGYFPENRTEQVLALGESLIEERRGKNEPLPNVPDVLPALCVIERLTGTDSTGEACVNAMSKVYGAWVAGFAAQFTYPNDDLYYLISSGDKLMLYPSLGDERGSNIAGYGGFVAALLLVTAWVALGVQTIIQWFLAPLVLRRNNRPLWRKHLEGRGEEPWYLSILGIVLLAGVGCLTAPISISEMITIQIGSPVQLFLGALIATACGGVLIGTLRRLSALFLVTFGVDIEETWADEILGIILGGMALYHFGNDLLAISLFALSDFLPGLVFMGIRRLLGRTHSTPPPAKQAPARTATTAPALMVGRAWPFNDLDK
jgi:hypothetical protein